MGLACPSCRRDVPESPQALARCPYCDGDLSTANVDETSFVVDGRDLLLIARRQRQLLWDLLLLVSATTLFVVERVCGPVPVVGPVLIFVAFGLSIIVMVATARLLLLLRRGALTVVLIVVLVLGGVLGLAVVVLVNDMARAVLRKAGLQVGFLGIREEDLLREFNRNICLSCGYNLIGNVSGRCPECGRAIEGDAISSGKSS